LECYNLSYSRYSRYYIGFYNISNSFNILLGSFRFLRLFILSHTELGLGLGLKTSRATLRSKYSREYSKSVFYFIKSKFCLKLRFYSVSVIICDHGRIICVICDRNSENINDFDDIDVRNCVVDCG
jgi:hypothetical protein